MPIYCISGLGADKQAFDKLNFPIHYEVLFIDWIEPIQHETLAQYAKRMAKDIDQTQEVILVGLSFGGIMSIEIAKLMEVKKIILISSISNDSELPMYYKIAGFLHVQKIPDLGKLLRNKLLASKLFGVKESKLKEYLFDRMSKTTDNYLQWSLDQISSWKQKEKMPQVAHIHGTADLIFPISSCKPDYIIKNGGHFMIVTHAKSVSNCIQTILTTLP